MGWTNNAAGCTSKTNEIEILNVDVESAQSDPAQSLPIWMHICIGANDHFEQEL